MFARNTIFILLALVLFVNAVPLRHRRRSCPPHKGSSLSLTSSTPSSTPVLNAGGSNTGVVKGNDDQTTTVKTTPTTSVGPSKSSSEVTSPPTSTKGLASSGKLASLFPIDGFSKSWSTSPLDKNALPLSDSTLNPTHLLTALSHSYVSAPDGKRSMKAHYPQGSYTFTHQPQGGFSFYALGPDGMDLSSAKEATLGYSVFFEEGFQFNKGGKLPGIYGGDSAEEAVSCSGGRRSDACFSARLMWRAQGKGEFYTYLPPYTDPRFTANKKQCDVAPESECNPTYGASVGRGAFKFATGAWTTVAERVRLNDVGKANGELELFVNGKSVISVSGLILRASSAGKMRGIQMQTFFGGSSPDFASPKTQDAYFSDFSVAVTEKL